MIEFLNRLDFLFHKHLNASPSASLHYLPLYFLNCSDTRIPQDTAPSIKRALRHARTATSGVCRFADNVLAFAVTHEKHTHIREIRIAYFTLIHLLFILKNLLMHSCFYSYTFRNTEFSDIFV